MSDRPENIFGILDVGADEVANSRFLYWLLKPDAGHQQGSEFLQKLLEVPGISYQPDWLEGYGCKREYREREAVVDILVYKQGRFALYLEHKIQAGPGASPDPEKAQLLREIRDLRALAHRIGAGEHAYAVYLSPWGKRPPNTDGWSLVRHADLARAFKGLQINSQRLRDLLADWMETVESWTSPVQRTGSSKVSSDEDARIDRLVVDVKSRLERASWWQGWRQVTADRAITWSISHNRFWSATAADGSLLDIGFHRLTPARLYRDLEPPELWVWFPRRGLPIGDQLRSIFDASPTLLLLPGTVGTGNYAIKQPVRQLLGMDRELYLSQLENELVQFFEYYAPLVLKLFTELPQITA